jgi:hypothetical protein
MPVTSGPTFRSTGFLAPSRVSQRSEELLDTTRQRFRPGIVCLCRVTPWVLGTLEITFLTLPIQLSQRARVRRVQISEEFHAHTHLPARPLPRLSPSCGPLLASSPNSPSFKHDIHRLLWKYSDEPPITVTLRRASRQPLVRPPTSQLDNALLSRHASTSHGTPRRPEMFNIRVRARHWPKGPRRRSEEHLSRSLNHLRAS